jgi:hypothetical protein
VRECAPTENVDVVNVKCPPLSVPDAIWFCPSKRASEPVGVPLPEAGVTAAVMVTPWPKTEGFAEDISAVVVAINAGGVVVGAEIFVTNAPHDPLAHLRQVGWNAPAIVGKDDDWVEPVTNILLELSSATPAAPLFAPDPPRNVENKRVEAVGLRTLTKASA